MFSSFYFVSDILCFLIDVLEVFLLLLPAERRMWKACSPLRTRSLCLTVWKLSFGNIHVRFPVLSFFTDLTDFFRLSSLSNKTGRVLPPSPSGLLPASRQHRRGPATVSVLLSCGRGGKTAFMTGNQYRFNQGFVTLL